MHISQAALDSTTILVTSTAGMIAFGAACWGARKDLMRNKLPSLLSMTALVFLVQMVHISTGLGFSSHLLGGLLMAVLFGPSLAMLSMGFVLAAQVAFLGAGTWSTLGANFLTMGVLAVYSGYLVYHLLEGSRSAGLNLIQFFVFTASVLASISVSAAFASLLIGNGFGSIVLSCLFAGLLELGLFVVLFAVCLRKREYYSRTVRLPKLLPVAGLCLLAVFFMPWSSDEPDGLEFASTKTILAED
jgi:cobalt/nickel transport system permease protein